MKTTSDRSGDRQRHWIRAGLSMLPAVLACLSSGAQAQGETEIRIDPSVSHQTMEGWGGNIYPHAHRHRQHDPALYDKAFRELHTTHMRVRSYWYRLEGENDNDDSETIDFDALKKYDKGLVRDEFLMQKAMAERGVKLLFASWRFPFWMIGKPADWRPKSGDRPAFPKRMEAEYVESLAAYMLYGRKHYGFTFDAVSVANEPMLGIYVKHDPARLVRMTRALKERLAKAGYTTRFYCPDVTQGDMTGVRRAESFFAQKASTGLSCCVAYHSYRPRVAALRKFRELARKVGLPVWVTEQNYTPVAPGDRFEWSHAMKNAVAIHDLLVESEMALCAHFCYVASSENGLVVYNPKSKKWGRMYDVLKQFHKHVPPGSVRVDAKPKRTANGVRTVAFRLPEKKGLTAVVVNASSKPQTVRVAVKGGAAAIESMRRSSKSAFYEAVDLPVAPGEDRPGLELAPRSVTSLTLRLP